MGKAEERRGDREVICWMDKLTGGQTVICTVGSKVLKYSRHKCQPQGICGENVLARSMSKDSLIQKSPLDLCITISHKNGVGFSETD